MKKIIALVLVMMFAVIAMTACSNSTTKATPTDAPAATEAATEAPAATEAATDAPAATEAPAETTAPATNG